MKYEITAEHGCKHTHTHTRPSTKVTCFLGSFLGTWRLETNSVVPNRTLPVSVLQCSTLNSPHLLNKCRPEQWSTLISMRTSVFINTQQYSTISLGTNKSHNRSDLVCASLKSAQILNHNSTVNVQKDRQRFGDLWIFTLAMAVYYITGQHFLNILALNELCFFVYYFFCCLLIYLPD